MKDGGSGENSISSLPRTTLSSLTYYYTKKNYSLASNHLSYPTHSSLQTHFSPRTSSYHMPVTTHSLSQSLHHHLHPFQASLSYRMHSIVQAHYSTLILYLPLSHGSLNPLTPPLTHHSSLPPLFPSTLHHHSHTSSSTSLSPPTHHHHHQLASHPPPPTYPSPPQSLRPHS